MPRKSHNAGWMGVGLFVLAALILISLAVIMQTTTKETRSCTVTGKDMTREAATKDKAAHSIYQVYTEQCGVLRVEDNWFQGVFNSADLYAQLQPQHTYQVTTIGWRIPILSQFPTVTKVVPQ